MKYFVLQKKFLPFFLYSFLSVSYLETAIFFLSQPCFAQKEACTCVPSFAPIVEKVLPAVVDISIQTSSSSDPTSLDDNISQWSEEALKEEFSKHPSLGAGFIIDPKGYIVTNRHVIQDAQEIKVFLHDGRELPAKIIARDKRTDLALLKVNSKSPLPYLTWADSRKARIGDWILVVGSPFGFGRSVSSGIISARGRDLSRAPIPTEFSEGIQSGYVDDLLQTDAAINLGNSGGPMVDIEGNVLGVNVAIFSTSVGSIGIGFAIPASIASHTIEQLKKKGKVPYGWIGVHVQEITPEIVKMLNLSESMKDNIYGALVSRVSPNGSAAKADIHPSDIILTFDKKPVTHYEKFPKLVGETPPGKKVPVEILRRGKKVTVTIEIGEMPPEDKFTSSPTQDSFLSFSPLTEKATPEISKQSISFSIFGITLSPLSSKELRQFSSDLSISFALSIQGIQSLSEAINKPLSLSSFPLSAGDILLEINQKPFASLEDVALALKKANAQKDTPISFGILKGNAIQSITLPSGSIFHLKIGEEGHTLLLMELPSSPSNE